MLFIFRLVVSCVYRLSISVYRSFDFRYESVILNFCTYWPVWHHNSNKNMNELVFGYDSFVATLLYYGSWILRLNFGLCKSIFVISKRLSMCTYTYNSSSIGRIWIQISFLYMVCRYLLRKVLVFKYYVYYILT